MNNKDVLIHAITEQLPGAPYPVLRFVLTYLIS